MAAPRVTLVGYRGCGKSSVAAALAARIGLVAVDLDREVETSTGRSIAEIFASEGEAAFRELESRVLAEILDRIPAAVLATGGGVVERPANRRLLRERARPVVYLQAPAAVLAARLAADGGGRPSLTGAGVVAEVTSMLARRDPWYREVADHVVDAAQPPAAVVDAVLAVVEKSRLKPG